MRNLLSANRRDMVALGIATLLYLVVVVLWSLILSLPEDANQSLASQKDLVYFSAWAVSGLYAVLGTLLTLSSVDVPRRERRRQFRLAVAAVTAPMAVGLVLALFNSIVLLPILPGILHPAMQLVIAGAIIAVSIFFGLKGAALPGQIVTRTYVRFGLGLMIIPTLVFLIHMPLSSDWSGPVRGVALGNAMLHGVLWAVLYAGILGANMLERPVVAKPAGRH